MTFKSKAEFAKAIIEAGKDGLIYGLTRVVYDESFTNPYQVVNRNMSFSQMHHSWEEYNEDWQPYVEPIPDKTLVWCWDDEYTSCRSLRVYDSKASNVFSLIGLRNGAKYDNMEVLTKEEIQPWMQELIDNCEE